MRCLNSRKAKEQGWADNDGAKERAMIATHGSKKEKELVVSLGPPSLSLALKFSHFLFCSLLHAHEERIHDATPYTIQETSWESYLSHS